jgi:hypothetical protein
MLFRAGGTSNTFRALALILVQVILLQYAWYLGRTRVAKTKRRDGQVVYSHYLPEHVAASMRNHHLGKILPDHEKLSQRHKTMQLCDSMDVSL